MVFTTTNLFKAIECPEGERCRLTNCIFGHVLRPRAERASESTVSVPASISSLPVKQKSNTLAEVSGTSVALSCSAATPSSHKERQAPSEAQTNGSSLKRKKPTYGQLADKPLSRAEQIKADLEAARASKSAAAKSILPASMSKPASLTRSVSPPHTNGVRVMSQQSSLAAGSKRANSPVASAPPSKRIAAAKVETLNPRLIPKAPDTHAKRTVFLKLMHTDMMRLNSDVKSSKVAINGWEPDRLALLVLDEQELIKLALDEEEKHAREHPTVYGNVIKNRIAAYRKMKLEVWTELVIKSFGKEVPCIVPKRVKIIDTGLTAAQEACVVQKLVVPDQSFLSAHGYIPTPPTEAQIEEAAKAVEASRNYEECDRCGSRFQVFPDRNEDGKLTTNGPCKFHPMKKVFPTKQKTDHYTGGNQPYHPCCMEPIGTVGCIEQEDHVFKTSNAARLAVVLPFITTPENLYPAADRRGHVVPAVCFDCEMGYTSLGFELIRLTAVSWPSGEELLDILVRPLGTVIDLNSRFSGVWPEHLTNAIPYDGWYTSPPNPATTQNPLGNVPQLPIVESPQKARELLCSYLTPSTPLMGHAIENDLNTTRLCHPSIIDTMLLYPHPRGLPFRYGLKMLSKKYLERDIQTGGERGHDSLEDAVATGDLVRVKVGAKWRDMKVKGWKFEDCPGERARLVAPEGFDPADDLPEHAGGRGVGRVHRGWRKKARGLDGAIDEGIEVEDDAANGVDEPSASDGMTGQLSINYLEQ